MNLLILGDGKGSWTMRGHQLGGALGARVTSLPTAADWDWAELVVLVKKHAVTFASEAQRRRLPIVWDALDFWRQPGDNGATQAYATALLEAQLQFIKPALVIGATAAMAAACDGVCVPHHSWAGLVPTPARERIQVLAYEGNAAYLGRWLPHLVDACTRRGWTFQINPSDLSATDILVAFRDGEWDGWMCREWKSGVKAVNAIAAGRPLISQDSAAVRELRPAGTVIGSWHELPAALDQWMDQRGRQAVVAASRGEAPRYTLEAVAAQYLALLAERRLAWAA